MITDIDRLEWLYMQNGKIKIHTNLSTGKFEVWDVSKRFCISTKTSKMHEAIDTAINYKKGE